MQQTAALLQLAAALLLFGEELFEADGDGVALLKRQLQMVSVQLHFKLLCFLASCLTQTQTQQHLRVILHRMCMVSVAKG